MILFLVPKKNYVFFFFFRMETNVFWQSCETMIFIFFFFWCTELWLPCWSQLFFIRFYMHTFGFIYSRRCVLPQFRELLNRWLLRVCMLYISPTRDRLLEASGRGDICIPCRFVRRGNWCYMCCCASCTVGESERNRRHAVSSIRDCFPWLWSYAKWEDFMVVILFWNTVVCSPFVSFVWCLESCLLRIAVRLFSVKKWIFRMQQFTCVSNC